MSKPSGFRSVHLHVPPQFHKKLKIAIAVKDLTLSDYIMQLVEADLKTMKHQKIPNLDDG